MAGPADLHAATVDLVESFYQFRLRSLGSWFGCEWPLRAAEAGVDAVWDEDLGRPVAVGGDEWVFFVFEGMCMGWSWALFFAQES
eukprot:110573-Alexandrium_andersonii.AAC.1